MRLIVIMGVSGSGKSTISNALGVALDYDVVEADDYHPESNIQKMTSGVALTDHDRMDWLKALNLAILSQERSPVILACSALTPYVQTCLEAEEGRECVWFLLQGSAGLIKARLKARKDHFMTDALLESQFEALNPPKFATAISIDQDVEGVLGDIMARLGPV